MTTPQPRHASLAKSLGALVVAMLLVAAAFVAVLPGSAYASDAGFASAYDCDKHGNYNGRTAITSVGELNDYIKNNGTESEHYLRISLRADLSMKGRESIVIVAGRKVIFELNGHVIDGSACANSAFTLRKEANLTLQGGDSSVEHVGYFEQSKSGGKLWKMGTNSSKERASVFGGLVTGFTHHAIVAAVGRSSITLQDATLAGNSGQSPVYIMYSNSSLTLNGSSIKWNYNTSQGGAVDAGEDGYVEGTKIVLDNSSISENVGKDGGGICVWRTGMASITLRNGSRISNNYANACGGGIYFNTHSVAANGLRDDSAYSDTSSITLSGGSEISGNVSASSGGGIYAKVAYAEGTSVRGRRTITLEGGSKISDNQAGGNGGGIYSEYDERTSYPEYPYMNVSVNGAEISQNKAKVGGGVYMCGTAWQQIDMKGAAHIDGNEATDGNGGGVYLGCRLADVSLNGKSTINNNKAKRSGGGVASDKNVTMAMDNGSEVNGNQALESEGGGMVFWGSGSIKLEITRNSQVSGNRAKTRGGGLSLLCSGGCYIGYDETSDYYKDKAGIYGTGTISYNAVLATDQATAGGGVYCGTNATLRNLEIYHNSLDSTNSSGGGVYVENRTATIINCSVTDNSTSGTVGGGIEVRSSGAAARAELGGKVVVEGNTNGKNEASDVHIAEKSSNKSDVEKDNNQLNNRIFECGTTRLAEGSRIGLQHWTGTNATKHAVSVRGWRVDAPESYFFADDPTWRAVKTSGNEIWLENEPSSFNVSVYAGIDAEAKTAERAYASTVTLNSKDYMAYDVKPDYYSVDGLDGVKTLTPDSNGNVSFTMPANDVTLTAHYTPCITGISVEVEDPNDYTEKGDVPVNVSKIVLKDSAGGETALTDPAEIAKIVASATRSHNRDCDWGAAFNYDVLLNPDFAETYGFTFVESKVTERSMQATWSNGNVYSPTGFCHVDVKEDGKVDVNMVASVGKEEFTVTTKYIDVNRGTEISEKTWKVAQGDEFNLDASLLLSQWVFTKWGDLPEGVTQDGSKVTINPVKGNVELTIYYKPVVTKIEIKVPELHVGEELPYEVKNFDIYDSSNAVGWRASSVNEDGEFAWTKLNYRGEEVDADDTVEGWTTYRLKIDTSVIASDAWQRSITDTFANGKNEVRITVNGQTQDVQCVTDADGNSTVTVLLSAVDSQAFDKVVTTFPTVGVSHAAACKDKVAEKVSYLNKSGNLHYAPITWDFSQVDDTMTSGEFTIKGTFTDGNGETHEVEQTFSLVDLYAPSASPDDVLYEGESVDVTLSPDSSFDGVDDAQVWYCVKAEGEAPSAGDYQLYEAPFAVAKKDGKSQVVFAYAKVGERVTSVSAQSYLFAERHNVTVKGGTAKDGEGNQITSALENSDVFITANEPGEGQTFEGWKIEASGEAPQIEDPSSTETSFCLGSSDVTVTALYSTAQYAVSFNTQGGSDVASQTVEHGKAATEPAAKPTREGYEFAGWYADAACTQEFDFTQAIKTNTTVYAKWAGLVTVSFDVAGGSEVEDRTVAEGMTVGGLPVPTREGYLFMGWYSGIDRVTSSTVIDRAATLTAHWKPVSLEVRYMDGYGALFTSTAEYGKAITPAAGPDKVGRTFVGWYNDKDCTELHDFTQPLQGNVALYGKWDLNTYTVGFSAGKDAGDATGIPENKTVSYGETLDEPEAPVRDGYVFKGWYTDEACTDKFDFGKAVSGDVNLYAKWAKLVTVTFDAGEGSLAEGEQPSRTVEAWIAVGSLPRAVREGYSFDGWYDGNRQVTSCTSFSADTTLTAKWRANAYTVDFYLDGEFYDIQAVEHGQTASEPAAEEREGYTFNGWYTDEGLTQEYSFSSEVTGDLSLYAGWTPKSYKVSFDAQGGSEVSAREVTYGDTVVAPDSPTREGGVFGGWYTDSNCTNKYSFDTPVTGETTLFAKWTELVTVKFDANGGADVATTTLLKGTAIAALPEATYKGHYLEGWYTKLEGGEKVEVGTKFNESTTLYAHWSAEQMVVGFADGDGYYDVAIVDYGSTLGEPEAPQKAGYTFDAWCTNKGRTIEYDFSKAVTDDFDLYARWSVNTYDVTFSAGEGVTDATGMPEGQKVEYGKTAKRPEAEPERDGYAFKGWYANEDCTVEYDFDAAVTGNVTAYAKWAKLVTVSFDTDGTAVEPRTIEAGSALGELPTTEKKDNVFIGWYLADGTKAASSTTFNEDATLTARWDQNAYVVRYYDSADDELLYIDAVNEGDKFTRPDDPKSVGYTFDGWYTKDGEKYNFDTEVHDDLDLYAKWTAETYTVKFSAGEDAAAATGMPADQTVSYGGTVAEPETDPACAGYVFKGWCSDEARNVEFSFSQPVTGSTTVYAKWAKLVTVSFDANGGSEVSDVQVEAGSSLGELPETSKDDYVFFGWRTQDGKRVTSSTVFTEDTKLTAEWGQDTFRVQFFASDGEDPTDFCRVTEGDKVGKPADPTREGYDFQGWYTSKDYSKEYDFSTPVHDDLDLYAKWAKKTYTVTFSAPGATNVPAAQTVEHGGVASRPATDPAASGLTFKGWLLDGKDYDFSAPVTGDITLEASWSASADPTDFCAIVFNSTGGSEVETKVIASGSSLGSLPVPSREGYTFAGWYLGDEQITAGRTFTESATLTARWVANTYPVYFTDNGAMLSSASVEYGKTASAPVDAPTKTGYAFVGWYADKELTKEYDFSTPVTGAVYLYAKWETARYTVSFSAGDGAGNVPAAQTVEYGEKAERPAAEPERDGYAFKGWYANEDCTVEFDFDAAVTGNVTAYAKWAKLVTITFDADGGTAAEPRTIEAGTCLGELPVTSAENYVFLGWRDDDDRYVSASTVFDKDTTLTAEWGQDYHYVQFFDSDGKTVLDFGRVREGETLVCPDAPVREGYEFGGWRTADGKEYDFENTPVHSDFDLYATWSEKSCSVSFSAGEASDATGMPEAAKVTYGATVSKPEADPVCTGYVFKGWYADEACTVAFNFSQAITQETTVWAKWNKLVTVTFDADGGEAGYDDEGALDQRTVEAGEPLGALPIPRKTNYDFVGWYLGDEQVSASTTVDGNVTLKARWSATTYSVFYVDAGTDNLYSLGTVVFGEKVKCPDDPAEQTRDFGGYFSDKACTKPFDFDAPSYGPATIYMKWTTKTVSVEFDSAGGSAVETKAVPMGSALGELPVPKRAGYTFAGWYAADGTKVSAFTVFNEDAKLTARWEQNVCSVRFLDADGKVLDVATVAEGEKATKPADPVREGYTFGDWYTKDGKEYDFDAAVSADLDLYAKWVVRSFSVSFDSAGGSSVESQTVEYGKQATKPADPTRAGYVFDGWLHDGKAYDFETAVTADVKLTASWKVAEPPTTPDGSNNGGSNGVPASGQQAKEKPALPQTGDESPLGPGVLAALIGAASALLCALGVSKRKN